MIVDSLFLLRIMLLLAVALSFYFNLHAVPLFDLDEGAFSEATREMFVRGDFISTFLEGNPRYDKPILIYWLQAASVYVFGVREFAFRLPSAIAASFWVLLVYLFGKAVRDERVGLIAGIITATAFMVSVMAKAATADALLNLWIACSMFAVYRYWQLRESRWLYAAFLAIGLGFLTKGPVAVLVPLAVSFLFFVLNGEWKAWFRMILNPIGILLFLAIALPWYVVQYLKEGDAFIQGFFFKHNIDRFQNPMESHGGGLLYYIPVVCVAILPFTSVLINALFNVKSLWRDDLTRFSLIWLLFVVLFFSFSGTKLPHYILYGLTGSFIIMAVWIEHMRSQFWLFMPQLLLFVALLLLPEIIDGALPGIRDPYLHEMLEAYPEQFSLLYRLYFVAAIMFTIACMGVRRYSNIRKLAVSGMLVAVSLSGFLLPVIGGLHQQPIKEAAAIAVRDNLTVIRWRLNTPSFSVYTQRVTETRSPEAGDVVLTKARYLDRLDSPQVLYRKGGVALVRVGNTTPAE